MNQKNLSYQLLILNFKNLNEFVKYECFKINVTKTLIKVVTKNCFMEIRDMKDVHYSEVVLTMVRP